MRTLRDVTSPPSAQCRAELVYRKTSGAQASAATITSGCRALGGALGSGPLSPSLLLRCCRQAGRELQRWAPEVGEELGLGGLEDSLAGPVQPGWDQFALNEAKFGVRTDYNEELYTTELDLRWGGRRGRAAQRDSGRAVFGRLPHAHTLVRTGMWGCAGRVSSVGASSSCSRPAPVQLPWGRAC